MHFEEARSQRTIPGAGVTGRCAADAMVPARTVFAKTAACVGGEAAAGVLRWSATPAAPPSGSRRTCSPRPVKRLRVEPTLEPLRRSRIRHHRQHTDVHNAEGSPAGNRRRPLPVERALPSHPKQTGARRSPALARSALRPAVGQDTPIRRCSSIENVDRGGCTYATSCIYTTPASAGSPKQPLPMA
jgi:hypothetical protein